MYITLGLYIEIYIDVNVLDINSTHTTLYRQCIKASRFSVNMTLISERFPLFITSGSFLRTRRFISYRMFFTR